MGMTPSCATPVFVRHRVCQAQRKATTRQSQGSAANVAHRTQHAADLWVEAPKRHHVRRTDPPAIRTRGCICREPRRQHPRHLLQSRHRSHCAQNAESLTRREWASDRSPRLSSKPHHTHSACLQTNWSHEFCSAQTARCTAAPTAITATEQPSPARHRRHPAVRRARGSRARSPRVPASSRLHVHRATCMRHARDRSTIRPFPINSQFPIGLQKKKKIFQVRCSASAIHDLAIVGTTGKAPAPSQRATMSMRLLRVGAGSLCRLRCHTIGVLATVE